MKTISNAKIIIPEGYQLSYTNNMPINISVSANPKLPNKAKGLLPTFVKINTVRSVASNCTALMIKGTSLAMVGRIFLTIVLAEVTIAFMPVICCMNGN